MHHLIFLIISIAFALLYKNNGFLSSVLYSSFYDFALSADSDRGYNM